MVRMRTSTTRRLGRPLDRPSTALDSTLNQPPPKRLESWARLVRIPNVFTIIADITSAFCLVVGGSRWTAVANAAENSGTPVGYSGVVALFGLSVAAGISLYWAGMILNDVFDVEADTQSGRSRPLTTGAIPIRTAVIAAVILFGVGILSAGLIGLVPLMLSIALVITIVLYDGPLKRTPIAPIVMGACRFLSFLLGAAAATVAIGPSAESLSAVVALGEPLLLGIRGVVFAFALGMGTFIAGITTFGRRETIGDRTIHLPIGLALMFLGALLLATAPWVAANTAEVGDGWKTAWQVDPVIVFPVAIFLMVAATLINGRRASIQPSPQRIQATIRSGLLAIIPIASAITMLALGAVPAIAVFALLLPSTFLAKRFAMT